MYTISDQCGQRIGGSPRGMVLVLLQVDNTRILSLISVVSEFGSTPRGMAFVLI